jgi:hypothetical protein
MGGYDYHGQGRNTGETRNFRAGRCIGACLEYAARMNKPVMIYVFSDGALSANMALNNTVEGRGKFDWASDNQAGASSFVLVFKPGERPVMRSATRLQMGSFTAGGDVSLTSSPAANNVNLLVEAVLLNYMALHGEEGQFTTRFPSNGLGAARDSLLMIEPVCNGTISNPV